MRSPRSLSYLAKQIQLKEQTASKTLTKKYRSCVPAFAKLLIVNIVFIIFVKLA